MADNIDDPEPRMVALETRLTYQDHAIDALNTAMIEQWAKIDALSRQVAALRERLREAETNAPSAPGTEPPPPHY